jgi:hypothetical protein
MDLLNRGSGNERSHGCARIQSRPNNKLLVNALNKLLDESIVHLGMNQEAIGTDAGLSCTPVLGRDCRRHRLVNVSVVENDEGCIPSQFQRQPLHGPAAVLHEQLSNSRRSSEADLLNERAGAKLLANLWRGFAVRRDELEHILGYPRIDCQLSHSNGG